MKYKGSESVFRKLGKHVASGTGKILYGLQQMCNRFYPKAARRNSVYSGGKKSKHICGRFYSHQLNKADRPEELKAYLLNRIPSYLQSNRILLSLFSFIVFLAGCSKQKEACTTTTGALVSDAETDTLENNNFVMGKPLAIENDSVAKIYKKDRSLIKGKNSTK
jgi:hypothetical protein